MPRSVAALALALACLVPFGVAPARASAGPSDSALVVLRRLQGYDGERTARSRAAEGLRAALAETLATDPADAGARAYAAGVRALRDSADATGVVNGVDSLRHGAEDLGDALSAQLLGLLYKSGLRGERDDARAVRYFLMATRAGGGCAVAPSHAQLAHAYFTGSGVPRSDSLAGRAVSAAYFGAAGEECRRRFGDRDLWVAHQGLFYIAGESRLHGDGVRRDVPGALFQFDKGARCGESACALRAAMLFLPPPDGDPLAAGGVDPDIPRARGYLEAAHDAGVAGAAVYLARCYADGLGGDADPARALAMYEAAAAAGAPGIRLEMASRLLQGEGVPRDSTRAHRELLLAAGEGDGAAMGIMGRLAYDRAPAARPTLRARRLAEAAGWFERGAAAGDAPSMYWLGVMYQKGQHYAQDVSTGAEWLARAKAAGYLGRR